MSALLRLIKHFCDLCINFTYTAGVCFFSSFFSEKVQSMNRRSKVMDRRDIPDVVQGLHSCVVVAVCLGVGLL